MLTKTEKSRRPTETESVNTSSVKEQLLHNFRNSKEYRHAFVEEKVRTSLAAQIKTIREQRGLSQPELAEAMGKSQSWVSRLEDPNQAPPTIPSLLKAAETFDVDLDIRFVRFSELLNRVESMTSESFEVPSFGDELASMAEEMLLRSQGDLGTTPETLRQRQQQAIQELFESGLKNKQEERRGIEASIIPIGNRVPQGATAELAPRPKVRIVSGAALAATPATPA
jgi:transcriptional regulator with XRE-family HTH domain